MLIKLDSYFILRDDMDSGLKYLKNKLTRPDRESALQGQPIILDGRYWNFIFSPVRLDANSAPDLVESGCSNLRMNPNLLVDFSNTVSISSAGLAAVSKLDAEAKERQGELRLVNFSDDVHRVIHIANYENKLNLAKEDQLTYA